MKKVRIIFTMFFLLPAITSLLPATEQKSDNESESFISEFFSYQNPVKKNPDEKIWFYKLSGWYERNTGNTDTLKSNLSTSVHLNNNISEFLIGGSGFYGESKGERNEKKGNAIIKYDHYIFSGTELFFFSESEHNKMTLLQHRNNTGTGSKYVFLFNKYIKFDISCAFVCQYENYETKRYSDDYRWSFRLKSKLTPVKPVELSYVYFYIPRIDDKKSYRLILDTYASVKISGHLSFKTGYINKYNKNALAGTKKTDENLYTQIMLDF